MSKKVKWGVMGTAGIAWGCTIPGMKKARNCELYAIAGRSLEKANKYKDEFGFEKAYGSYEELLNDPEVTAVYIPLANHVHYEWIMKSLEAGKYVLCEKPMVTTKKESEELFAAAKKNNVVLAEAYAYLHSPYVDALKEDVEKLGDLRYLEAAFLTQRFSEGNFRFDKDKFGGVMYDLGCYGISLILRLLDKKPISIKGVGEFMDTGVDEFSTVFMRFSDKLTASVRCGMTLGPEKNGRYDEVYIHGTNGYIKSHVAFNQSGTLKYEVCVDGKTTKRVVKAPDNYMLEVEQLGKVILDKEKPHISADFSIMAAEVLESAADAIGY